MALLFSNFFMSFKQFYNDEVKPKLNAELKLKNPLQTPNVVKIVVNVGASEALTNKNVLEKISGDLRAITGQKPVITLARKSISAFKLRKGVPIGVKVTLREKRMYDFLEKLIKIILPRIRDFRGIAAKNFDGGGNLNIGLSDQTLFPEIDYDTIDRIRGLEITIVTTAKKDEEGKRLLELLGLPFAK